MRNKKHRPELLIIISILCIIIGILLCFLLQKRPGIWLIYCCILFSVLFLITSLVSYIKVTNEMIILSNHYIATNESDKRFFSYKKIAIKDIWAIEICEYDIHIMLKQGYRVTYRLLPHLNKKKLVNLFKEVQQQVIEQSKDNE